MSKNLLVTLLTAWACTGCAASDEELSADLQELIDGYESWQQSEVWTGVQASPDGTHGDYVQIWQNDLALGSEDEAEAAEGSILVKRGYDDEAGEQAKAWVTVMWKVSGYDKEHGDWFWFQLQDDGSVAAQGAASGCYSCHTPGSDYRLYLVDDE